MSASEGARKIKKSARKSKLQVDTCVRVHRREILRFYLWRLHLLDAKLDEAALRSICRFHWTHGTKELVAYHL
jgi:hypothetical protein